MRRLMSQTHFLPQQLRTGKKSWVYYSKNPNRKAIIFVHGFNGDAISTWSQFDRELFREPRCAQFDIVFFGYEGKAWTLESCAQYYYQFLERIFRLDTRDRQTLKFPIRPDFKYEELIIVAHSMGSVVTRRALLIAEENRQVWSRRTKLALFAPVHLGARVVRLLSESFPGFPLKLLNLLRYRWPPLEELSPESDYLKELKRDVETAIRRPGCKHLAATRVAHSFGDNVIEHKDKVFCSDPKAKWIDGSHSKMCKPTSSFRAPIDHLLQII
jgi:pimeloyl-ACP methyl ester carboxylesterase